MKKTFLQKKKRMKIETHETIETRLIMPVFTFSFVITFINS